MMQKKKHSKHANLIKPNYGSFGRNEWAFLGAPCDLIKDLVQSLAKVSEDPVLYIDESHNKSANVGNLSVTTKMGERQSLTKGLEWNKNGNFIQNEAFDYIFVNGNHFIAEKQIIILDPRKEESLSRKIDRLSNPRAVIYTDEVEVPYDFLQSTLGEKLDIAKFHISDIQGIWKFIQDDLILPPLKALVLAGGKSQRMGKDKGNIDYHGKEQSIHLYEMLESLGLETYISCREEQKDQYSSQRQIHDSILGLGPFGAIVSAFRSDPNAAWLVVPCDLPLLKREQLKQLISNRNSRKFATAFLNNKTNFPEPLISIWEPKMYQRMLGFLAQGYSCPRKTLINSEVELIEVSEQGFMMNANTPEDMKMARKLIEKET